jgi:hypothetical protein
LSSGVVPPPSKSGWQVRYDDPLRLWLRDAKPELANVFDLTAWIRRCEQVGPPPNAVAVGGDDDLFIAKVNSAVAVEYLVVTYEYLIIIRKIQ